MNFTRPTISVLAILLLCISEVVQAALPLGPLPEPFTGTISRFTDADGLFVSQENGREVKIRVRYGDAPEIAHNRKQVDQPGGRESLAYAKKHWQGKGVIVTPRYWDRRYHRIVADVRAGSTDYATDLVAAGHMWVDPRYKPPQPLRDAETAAKRADVGLWAGPGEPTPPWEWRKQQRERRFARLGKNSGGPDRKP